MKKLIVSVAVLFAIGVATVSASPVDLDPRVEKTFQKEFSGAEHVKWSEDQEYIKASFVLGGQRTQAWFNKEGMFVGSIRGISYNQLPLLVTRSLNDRFSQPILIELREVTNAEGTRYKLVIEEKNRKYRVSIDPDGNFEEKQRIKE